MGLDVNYHPVNSPLASVNHLMQYFLMQYIFWCSKSNDAAEDRRILPDKCEKRAPS